jgi:hypothetical protein
MARSEQDPAASTQQFRAFATKGEPASKSPNTGLIVAGVIVAIIVIVVIALLVV